MLIQVFMGACAYAHTHAAALVTHTTFELKASSRKPLTHECPHTRSSSHLPLCSLAPLVCDTEPLQIRSGSWGREEDRGRWMEREKELRW